MNAPDASPAPPTYKDRRAGLVAFGIVQIILGGFIALMIPLIFFAQHVAARQQAGAVYPPSLAFVLAVYGTLAMVLVSLGIGSIMTRRWARALTLVGAWSWLIIGVFSLAFQIVLLPRLLATPGPTGATMPHAALAAMMVTMLVVLGIVFVALPAIFVWFYGTRRGLGFCAAGRGLGLGGLGNLSATVGRLVVHLHRDDRLRRFLPGHLPARGSFGDVSRDGVSGATD